MHPRRTTGLDTTITNAHSNNNRLYFCARTKEISARSQPAPKGSQSLENFDHRLGGGSRARGVLTGDEAAIDKVEVIPDARSALV